MVNVGDKIPEGTLFEKDPGDKVDIAEQIGSGDALIIGVPAAFSTPPLPPHNYHLQTKTNLSTGPTCSDSHIPEYIANPKLKNAGKVFVISVNDPFV